MSAPGYRTSATNPSGLLSPWCSRRTARTAWSMPASPEWKERGTLGTLLLDRSASNPHPGACSACPLVAAIIRATGSRLPPFAPIPPWLVLPRAALANGGLDFLRLSRDQLMHVVYNRAGHHCKNRAPLQFDSHQRRIFSFAAQHLGVHSPESFGIEYAYIRGCSRY